MNLDSSSLQTKQLTQSGLAALQRQIPYIDKLPNELLMRIFECDMLPRRQNNVWWDPDHPAKPYESVSRASKLTRVSKRWYTVARMTCRIWGFLCIPATVLELDHRSAQLRQLIDTLKRSGATPLSVFLPWDIPGVEWPSRASMPKAARRVFRELGQHADRLQRLRLELPAEGAQRKILTDLLERPTPALEYLHVSCQHRILENGVPRITTYTRPGLLPACPRLTTAHLGVDGYYQFGMVARALVHLSVDSPAMHGKLWEVLSCTPNIETLRLSVVEDRILGDLNVASRDQLLASPIVLASLRRLEVTSYWMSKTLALAAEYTRMPNLAALVLPHRMIWEPTRVDEVVLFITERGDALTKIVVWEDTQRKAYKVMSVGVDTFWTSMSSTPFLAPRLRTFDMFEIVDIPGPRAWGALVSFRDARKAAQNAGSPFDLSVKPGKSPLAMRKPIARGGPPAGMVAAHGRWY